MPAGDQVRSLWAAALAAAVLSFALPAAAAETCDIPVAETVRVAQVGEGGELLLSDGRRARLAAIDLVGQQTLSDIAEQRAVALAFADKATDRHGDLIAQVFVDGNWLQGELVTAGQARVRTRADMRRCARALLAREAEARKAKRGLWTDPLHRIRKPDELGGDIGTFQIVEGRVLAVATSRGRAFLNFGQNRYDDFTVTITPAALKRMLKEGANPAQWAGKTIRVRGWLALLNGPELEVTHAEQIELLD